MPDFTPMMKQYLAVKEQNKDSLLFFRLGDFYELFFDDALLASRELDLVLTGKSCGVEERAPMCGIPFHSSESYIARLISKGYKVSICEQVEDPALAKGLVKREIVQTVSPGTVTEASMLDDRKSNYISGIYADRRGAGIVFIDVSTGECTATLAEGNNYQEQLELELSRFSPSEIVMNATVSDDERLKTYFAEKLSSRKVVEDDIFDYSTAEKEVTTRFPGLRELQDPKNENLVTAVGALLVYLKDAKKSDLAYINKLTLYDKASFLEIGDAAFKSLEISETIIGKDRRGSLLGVMDTTITGMGSRMLRKWVEKPLYNPALIIKRQNAVEELYNNTFLRGELAHILRSTTDIERLISRIVYGTANCRDLRALYETAVKLPSLIALLANVKCALLRELREMTDPLEDITTLVDKAIIETPPHSLREGGMIKDGYDTEVDRLRYVSSHGKELVAAVEAREREKTGIKNLRVTFNKVFGYSIEITKSNLQMVPGDYIRKQTLVNSERYITEELKNIESDILTSQDKLASLEYNLFVEIRDTIAKEMLKVQSTAKAIASLDALLSFAENAVSYNYVRPEVDLSDTIEIVDGRHPVVERIVSGNMFVPNDTLLDNEGNRIAIITGPNMAGKSTYMRQVALIALMAQTGSFVPAKKARIGVVDKIFTRVGASDDLSTGRSTFMVEMSEVAEILKSATTRSLLILDEIGRGTSTFDGMAIARAVIEYIADKRKVGAKTLFATHYHELTSLEDEIPGLRNYNIAVKKRGDTITFLRKIVPGGADDSYGIEVALLAGLPTAVISRSKEILKAIENDEPLKSSKKKVSRPEAQLSFLSSAADELQKELAGVNVEMLTPIEAMNVLYRLVNKARE